MSEFWSFGSVVALWIGISCSLWWLHRRRIHGRQDRQLALARQAAARAAEAQTVYKTIRTSVPLDNPPDDQAAWLRAETHALLKRIQDQGPFFDEVTSLRVQLQAVAKIEEHEALAEILQLRRDLWAASEIVLIEDPARFGATFAEEGAYERFQAEALQLLFKREDSVAKEEAPIELRLGLAREDARRFADELQATIEEARERDRLPTLSELLAYPAAFFRAMPLYLRSLYRFLRAFLAHAAELAQAIRESETMERGAARFRQARTDWPQQLSTGFQRASATAKGSAASLRRHYDFLVAAYDFQAKYEAVLQRAPEITERGRQFLARLELAERSERLRLTSANAMIWVTRRTADALAQAIATLQRFHTEISRTGVWALAARLLAPAPDTGRRVTAFRSYRRALAASGLSETPSWRQDAFAHTEQPASRRRTAKARQKETERRDQKTRPKAAAADRRSTAAEATSPAKDKPVVKRAKNTEAQQTSGKTQKAKGKAAVIAIASPQAEMRGASVVAPQTQTEEGRRSAFGFFRRRASEEAKAEPVVATVLSEQADAPRSRSKANNARARAKTREAAPVTATSTGGDAIVGESGAPPDSPTVEVSTETTGDASASIGRKKKKQASGLQRSPKARASDDAEQAAAAAQLTEEAGGKRWRSEASLFERSRRSAAGPGDTATNEIKQSGGKADVALPQEVASAPAETHNEASSSDDKAAIAAKTELKGVPSRKKAKAGQRKVRKKATNASAPVLTAKAVESATMPDRSEIMTEPSRQDRAASANDQGIGEDRTRLFATTPAPAAELQRAQEPATELPAAAEKPQKRRSFFSRLLTRHLHIPRIKRDTAPLAAVLRDAAQSLEDATRSAEALSLDPPRPLMEKLSSLEAMAVEDPADMEEDGAPVEPDETIKLETQADEGIDTGEESETPEEPGPLTLSILELQAKMEPKAPSIKSFPWLRG